MLLNLLDGQDAGETQRMEPKKAPEQITAECESHLPLNFL